MASATAVSAVATGEDPNWTKTLDVVTKAVVAIKKRNTIPFDGAQPSCSQATGFIVDKEQGIILTNRHVVGTAPSMVEVMFLNKEEVSVIPVYRDPVHDFGFYRFDPKDLEFMELFELPLNPAGAIVGTELRVVGNDSGEKLSILSGTLARLDRQAPAYHGAYNDFNTFYLGAASSTSGGSSGSPVVNIKGEVIGLNAGGKPTSASSYYLPLDRVVRALRYIKARENVPRGTLQTLFEHKAFNELKRLGLKKDEEMQVRKQFAKEDVSGLLVVHHLLPGGTGKAAGLEPGDILLEMGNTALHNFVQLETMLDDCAEKKEELQHEIDIKVRRGDKVINVKADVQDLHSIIPDQLFRISGGVLHPLSYMLARLYNVPAGSVYLAGSSLMFMQAGIPRDSIIKSVNAVETPDINTFIEEMRKYSDGDKLLMKFSLMSSPTRVLVASVLFEGKYFPMQRAFRNDMDGLWHFEEVEPLKKSQVKKTSDISLAFSASSAMNEDGTSRPIDDLVDSMVMVKFVAPHLMDGMDSMIFSGTGFVIDAKNGLVVCSRSVIPCSLGTVLLSIASEIQLQAEVVYIHPMLTYSVVKFNPNDPALNEADVKLKDLKLSQSSLQTLDSTTFVGLTARETKVRMNDVTVTYVTRIPAVEYWPAVYFPTNQVTYKIDKVKSTSSKGGLLLDGNGAVQAFFWEYSQGSYSAFPASQVYADVEQTFNSMQNKTGDADYRTLGLSVTSKPISKVRDAYKIDPERITKLKERIKDKKLDQKHVLTVSRMMTSYPPADFLKIGDILLDINGTPVADVEDIESNVTGKDRVKVIVQRDQQEAEFEITTASLPIAGTAQIVYFSGLMVQPIYPHVAFSSFMPDGAENGGVFIVRRMSGSPANQSGIPTNVWITHVNDNPVKDIDSFLQAVEGIANVADTRIKTVNKQGVRRAYTLKTDFWYFGTRLLERKAGTVDWSFQNISVAK